LFWSAALEPLVGALSTIPLAFEVLGGDRLFDSTGKRQQANDESRPEDRYARQGVLARA
jgi:hypothetical protein